MGQNEMVRGEMAGGALELTGGALEIIAETRALSQQRAASPPVISTNEVRRNLLRDCGFLSLDPRPL